MTEEKNHHIIVRPLKYLLSRNSFELEEVLNHFNDDIVYKLYHGCLAEGYYKIPSYQTNFKLLSDEKNRRNI